MKQKMFVGVILLVLVSMLLVGCSKTASPSSPIIKPDSTDRSAPQSNTSTSAPPPAPLSSNDNPDDSSSVLQSSLPLQITQPADGATLNAYTVTVAGKTQPGSIVSVNDAVTTADSGGNFSINISLDDGLNAIDIIAEDSNGNQGEVLLLENVVVSQSYSSSTPVQHFSLTSATQDALALNVSSPVDGAILTLADIVVKGQTQPGATVAVNDEIDMADNAGNFNIPVTLVSGANIIDITASDDAGNAAELILMVDLAAGA